MTKLGQGVEDKAHYPIQILPQNVTQMNSGTQHWPLILPPLGRCFLKILFRFSQRTPLRRKKGSQKEIISIWEGKGGAPGDLETQEKKGRNAHIGEKIKNNKKY